MAEYDTFLTDPRAFGGEYIVEANPDEGTSPVFATCNGLLVECPNTLSLAISFVFPVETSSFGAIKSLY